MWSKRIFIFISYSLLFSSHRVHLSAHTRYAIGFVEALFISSLVITSLLLCHRRRAFPRLNCTLNSRHCRMSSHPDKIQRFFSFSSLRQFFFLLSWRDQNRWRWICNTEMNRVVERWKGGVEMDGKKRKSSVHLKILHDQLQRRCVAHILILSPVGNFFPILFLVYRIFRSFFSPSLRRWRCLHFLLSRVLLLSLAREREKDSLWNRLKLFILSCPYTLSLTCRSLAQREHSFS